MDYILDKKIRFNSKKEKTLYAWSLDELGNQEKDHKKDLIPYRFSIHFDVKALRVVRTSGAKDKYSDGEVSLQSDNRVSIHGNLTSSYRPHLDSRQTSFYMFGTDRQIDSISLTVENLGNNSDFEACVLWASPSYKSEIDWREFTEPDHISVTIALKAEQFENFVRMIELGCVGDSHLLISQVDGFYAPWSPSISTRSIKVLTEYHEVEGEIDLDKPLPIIGNVGEFSLTFVSSTLELKQKVEEDTFQEDEIFVEKPVTKVEMDNSKMLAVTESLKKPLWWILFVLILILLNQ